MFKRFLNLFKSDLPPIQKDVYQELHRLNDRELSDIGISRSQISMVARGIDPQKGVA